MHNAAVLGNDPRGRAKTVAQRRGGSDQRIVTSLQGAAALLTGKNRDSGLSAEQRRTDAADLEGERTLQATPPICIQHFPVDVGVGVDRLVSLPGRLES